MELNLDGMSLLNALERFSSRRQEFEGLLSPAHAHLFRHLDTGTSFSQRMFIPEARECRQYIVLELHDGRSLFWGRRLTWTDTWYVEGDVILSLPDEPYQVLIRRWPIVVAESVEECITLLDSVIDTLLGHFEAYIGQEDLLAVLAQAERQDTYPNF